MLIIWHSADVKNGKSIGGREGMSNIALVSQKINVLGTRSMFENNSSEQTLAHHGQRYFKNANVDTLISGRQRGYYLP